MLFGHRSPKSRAMAEIFGAPALIVQRSHGAPVSGLAYATAAGLGVPAFIAEDGGAGQYDPAIAIGRNGLICGVGVE
jgi:hypothetical protein